MSFLELILKRLPPTAVRWERGQRLFPVRGMLILLIFVMILIEHGKKFEQKDCAVEKALTGSEKVYFEFFRYLSAATIPAFAGIVLLAGTGSGTFFLKEVLAMMLFVVNFGGLDGSCGKTFSKWNHVCVLDYDIGDW